MKPELFYFEACPYCKRVTDFIQQNLIQNRIILKEIRKNREDFNQLLTLTEDDQVPCLVHRGEIILDSEKIIHWLSTHMVHQ